MDGMNCKVERPARGGSFNLCEHTAAQTSRFLGPDGRVGNKAKCREALKMMGLLFAFFQIGLNKGVHQIVKSESLLDLAIGKPEVMI